MGIRFIWFIQFCETSVRFSSAFGFFIRDERFMDQLGEKSIANARSVTS